MYENAIQKLYSNSLQNWFIHFHHIRSHILNFRELCRRIDSTWRGIGFMPRFPSIWIRCWLVVDPDFAFHSERSSFPSGVERDHLDLVASRCCPWFFRSRNRFLLHVTLQTFHIIFRLEVDTIWLRFDPGPQHSPQFFSFIFDVCFFDCNLGFHQLWIVLPGCWQSLKVRWDSFEASRGLMSLCWQTYVFIPLGHVI